jgi:hypothetical protein
VSPRPQRRSATELMLESAHDRSQIMAAVSSKAESAKAESDQNRGNQDKRGPRTNGALTGELFAKFLQSEDLCRLSTR